MPFLEGNNKRCEKSGTLTNVQSTVCVVPFQATGYEKSTLEYYAEYRATMTLEEEDLLDQVLSNYER